MNSIRRAMAARRRTGESAYMILLIISCVALAVAVFFPTFEYFALYRGEPVAYKFDRGATARPLVKEYVPKPGPAAPAAPAPAPTQDTGGVTAPAPVDEPAPVDASAPTSQNRMLGGGMATESSKRGPVPE